MLLAARDRLDGTVAARARAGQVARVARGVYLPIGDGTARELALARIAAADLRLAGPHWFSHESAALLWGLPVWRVPALTHVRTPTRGGPGRDRDLRRHRDLLPDGMTTQVNGLPVTTLTLTAVDCARTLPALAALVVLDASLRAGVDRADAAALLGALTGQRGVRRARTLLAYADAGAESPPETATRYHLLCAGLPVPVTQVQTTTRRGTYWADLGIPQWRLLIEYDGRDKYTDRSVLVAEKHRQDAIMETGRHLVRITADDSPAQVVARTLAYAPRDFRPTPRPDLVF